MLLQWTESIDFSGVVIILIESTVSDIFGFYAHSSYIGFCTTVLVLT